MHCINYIILTSNILYTRSIHNIINYVFFFLRQFLYNGIGTFTEESLFLKFS